MEAIIIGGGSTVLTAGDQGPAGPQGVQGPVGPQGQPGPSTIPLLSARNMSGVDMRRGAPVVMQADGTIILASAVTAPRVAGFVYDAIIAADAFGFIQIDGPLDGSVGDWETATGVLGGLVIGQQYYLSTVAGQITATPNPINTVAPVGKAVTTTRFVIDVDPPIFN